MSSKRAIRRREQRKGCKRKVRHVIAKFARREAQRMSEKSGEQMIPYRCRFCGGWHVGHARDSQKVNRVNQLFEALKNAYGNK